MATREMVSLKFTTVKSFSWVIVIFFVFIGIGFSQLIPYGTVVGAVRDPKGGLVPNAQITLTDLTRGVKQTTRSNGLGEYRFSSVFSGQYRLEATAPGFQRWARPLTVQAGRSTTVNVSLQIGSTKQIVEVSAQAPMLQTTSGSLGTVITSTELEDLPLAGRNPLQLINLTPGISVFSATGVSGRTNTTDITDSSYFDANGSYKNLNGFTMDGASDNLLDRVVYIPSPDMLQEINVRTNSYDAQYGSAGGALVTMISKRGTNHFHGDVYDYLQNSALDASGFFANLSHIRKTPFVYNQFGVAAGGPIQRDKTFWFFNFEGIRNPSSGVAVGTVPTAAQRSGDFSQTFDQAGQPIQIFNPFTTRPNPSKPGQFIRDPFSGNKIPSSMINSAGKGLLTLLALPNRAGLPITGQDNLVDVIHQTNSVDNYMIRMDHELGSRTHLFGRFSTVRNLATSVQFPDTVVGASQNALTEISASFGLTTNLNPSTEMDFFSGFARWNTSVTQPHSNLTSLGFSSLFASQVVEDVIPQLGIGGISGFGGGFSSYDYEPRWSEGVNFVHMHGRHALKTGFETIISQSNSGSFTKSNPFSFTGAFTRGPSPFNVAPNSGYGLADLLLGTVTSGTYNIQANSATTSPYYAAYFQDDFRATPKLSLTLGVRWEVWQPATERFNRETTGFAFGTANPIEAQAKTNYAAIFPKLPAAQQVLSPSQFDVLGGLLYASPSNRRWGKTYWNNWSPRIGVAYQLGQKTVLRGGFGYFYGDFWAPTIKNTGFASSSSMVGTLDGITPFDLLNNPFPQGLVLPTGSSQGLLSQLGSGLSLADQFSRPVRNARWNAGLERMLGHNLMVSAYYVGETAFFTPLGTNQSDNTQQLHFLPGQYLSLGSELDTLIPNPFSGLISKGSLGHSKISLGNFLETYPEFTGVSDKYRSGGKSYYNALQLSVTKRYSSGLTLLGSYTWSKALGRYDLINDFDPSPSTMFDRYDDPQQFSIAGVYQLPFGPGQKWGSYKGVAGRLLEGWQYSLRGTFQSGQPIPLDANLVWTGLNPTLPVNQRGPFDWFNKAAFIPQQPFTARNTSWMIGSLRGDAINDWDMALFKTTTLHENIKLQFRTEWINAFNRVQFGGSDGGGFNVDPTSPSYGTVFVQGNQPRIIQMALRLMW